MNNPLIFSSMAFIDLSIPELAKRTKRLGYEGIELLCHPKGHITEKIAAKKIREIKNVFDEKGLRIFSLSGYSKFTAKEKTVRDRNLTDLYRQIDIAHALGASGVRVLGGPVSERDWAENKEYFIDLLAYHLSKAADHAKGSNVTILQSTHDNFSTGEVCNRLLNKVNGPGVSILWCVIHPFEYGEDLHTTWNYVKDRIRLVHFKDAINVNKKRQLKPLGEGKLPLDIICRLLKENNYTGPISIEWEKHMYPEIEDSESVLLKGKEFIEQYM